MNMSFDGLVTAAVVSELNKSLIGAKVQQIRQHNEYDVTLELRVPGFSYELFISADARFPRFLTSTIKRPSLPQPPTFCMTCRKHLSGYFLTSIRQRGFDRIVFFDFESRSLPKRTLVVEIMGKHSNLILCDENDKILASIKNIGRSVSRIRQILAGRIYELPPETDKLDIQEVSAELFETIAQDSLPSEANDRETASWIMDNFSGFGPFLANEILLQSRETNVSLADVFQSLRNIVLTEDYKPVTVFRNGVSIFAYPIPPQQLKGDIIKQESSISLALDMMYNLLISRTAFEEQRSQLTRMIRKSAEAAKQNIEACDKALLEAENSQRYKEIGELLSAAVRQIPNGAAETILVDYYDPELKEIKVELNPKLTARENADRYFKKYKKLKEGVETAEARRRITVERLSKLDSARLAVDSAEDLVQVKKIRDSLIAQDLLREIIQTGQQTKEKEDFDGYRIRKISTPEGWEILYGENAISNDYLTQRIARPNDIWLHTRSIVGAHVVIRTGGHSGDVPAGVLREAARIAARNSDAKHSSLVPVDHTLRKYVRKPKNAVPGYVIYRMEKTIDIQPQ